MWFMLTINRQNDIGGIAEDELYVVRQSLDGGFILGGYSYSNISGDKTENNCGNMDYWIVKLDSIGNILWQKTLRGSQQDWFRCLQLASDGGCLVGGWSGSNIACEKNENSIGADDIWILKLAPDSLTEIPEYFFENSDYLIFPNPTNGKFTIALGVSNSTNKILISDVTGNICYINEAISNEAFEVDLSGNASGIYIVKFIQVDHTVV
jgi:hypothetical protein